METASGSDGARRRERGEGRAVGRGDAPKTLLLALSSLALALSVAEMVVRVWIPVRNVGPSFSVFDPVYGSKLKPHFSAVRITPEFTMRLTTNSRGFRGSEPGASMDRPILFLGDSFALGYGVDDGQEYPALVGELLSARLGAISPVINAGIGDVGTGRWVRFLREEGPALDPRAVVLQLSSNDFQDDSREGFYSIGADGSLVESRGPRRAGIRRMAQGVFEIVPWLPYSRLVSLLRGLRFGKPGGREAPAREGGHLDAKPFLPTALTLRIVEAIVGLCQSRQWPVLLLAADFPDTQLPAVAALAADLRVPLVRVPAKAERPDLYYRVDAHWNAAGHAHAARLTADALAQLLGVSASTSFQPD
jgi:hypothetical protein